MAEQTTAVLTPRPKMSLEIERRAWRRFPNEQDIICHPVTSGPRGEPELAWLGKVRDISPAGIGLSMSRRFDPGVELVAELSVKPDASLLLPVRVVHATPHEKEQWIIGCEFIFPLSQEELQICLRQKSADQWLGGDPVIILDCSFYSSAVDLKAEYFMTQRSMLFEAERSENDPRTERRAWVRFGSEQEVCCLPATPSAPDEPDAAWLAIVRDVSPCGIGLTTKRRFEPGTVLILELSATPKEVTRPLPVRVVHAAQEGKDRWIIGCAFAAPLRKDELQKFLEQ
jgi:hypothetical protein